MTRKGNVQSLFKNSQVIARNKTGSVWLYRNSPEIVANQLLKGKQKTQRMKDEFN